MDPGDHCLSFCTFSLFARKAMFLVGCVGWSVCLQDYGYTTVPVFMLLKIQHGQRKCPFWTLSVSKIWLTGWIHQLFFKRIHPPSFPLFIHHQLNKTVITLNQDRPVFSQKKFFFCVIISWQFGPKMQIYILTPPHIPAGLCRDVWILDYFVNLDQAIHNMGRAERERESVRERERVTTVPL